MYNKIYDFCKVRNLGNIYKNCPENLTPRIKFIIDILESQSIPYEIDQFEIRKTFGFNIVLRGTSNKMVVAHHDISNPNIDNAASEHYFELGLHLQDFKNIEVDNELIEEKDDNFNFIEYLKMRTY